jgi:hypothetical protein
MNIFSAMMVACLHHPIKQQNRHFIFFVSILLKYVSDNFVTLNGTAIIAFDLENAPYLVMFTKIGELKIKLACNKHAFTVPI